MLQNKPSRIPIWVDAFLLSVVSIFYLRHSWQKWADPIIDFGREVYVPWRIINGEVLYKDLSFLYGAFPPYWNALLFKIFGPSILTLALFNIFVVGIQTFLTYRLCYKLFDRLCAFMAAAVFLLLFAFNQLNAQNMNYITPYSQSYTYSIFLGFCSIYVFHSYTRNPRPYRLFLLGLILGLALLSRLEIFLTIVVSVLTGLILLFKKSKKSSNEILEATVILISGFYIPVLTFLIYFSKYFSIPVSFLNIVGYNPSWKEIAGLHFYKFTAGFIGWQTNLKMLALTLVWYVVLFIALHMLCKGLVLRAQRGRYLLAAFLIVCAGGILAYAVHITFITHISKIFRGQILFIVLIGILYFKKFLCSVENKTKMDALAVIVFCLWALLMMYKVPLFAVNYFYGRYHCLPGVLLSVAYLVHVIPSLFNLKYRMGWAVRTLVCALLILVCGIYFVMSIMWANLRYIPLSHGANRLWAYDKTYPYGAGPDVRSFLTWAETNIDPDQTYVTFPEGIMLNFLTKNKISGPHMTFMPIEMATYGEDAMLKPLMENPPDYFIFANRDLLIYGKIAVGYNYGTKITQWLSNEYTPVWQSVNYQNPKEFGITVFRKLNR